MDFEALVLKLLPIDGLSSGSVSGCEVSSLDHELFDDAVKDGSYQYIRSAGQSTIKPRMIAKVPL